MANMSSGVYNLARHYSNCRAYRKQLLQRERVELRRAMGTVRGIRRNRLAADIVVDATADDSVITVLPDEPIVPSKPLAAACCFYCGGEYVVTHHPA